MQTREKRCAKALPADVINVIVAKYLRRDPAQCIENHEGCAGSTNLRQCLEILEEIIIDLFDDHLAETPNLPAPRVDDSILLQIAQTNATEDPVQFIRNHWVCASSADVVAALKEVREAHEAIYNDLSARAGLLTEATAAPEPVKPAALMTQPHQLGTDAPVQPEGWQPYATAPRDGTLVDLFYKKTDGTKGRITNVRFIQGAAVNVNYAPGGCWEHLSQNGWRHSVRDDSVLVDVGFTHWRLVDSDEPKEL